MLPTQYLVTGQLDEGHSGYCGLCFSSPASLVTIIMVPTSYPSFDSSFLTPAISAPPI